MRPYTKPAATLLGPSDCMLVSMAFADKRDSEQDEGRRRLLDQRVRFWTALERQLERVKLEEAERLLALGADAARRGLGEGLGLDRPVEPSELATPAGRARVRAEILSRQRLGKVHAIEV